MYSIGLCFVFLENYEKFSLVLYPLVFEVVVSE